MIAACCRNKPRVWYELKGQTTCMCVCVQCCKYCCWVHPGRATHRTQHNLRSTNSPDQTMCPFLGARCSDITVDTFLCLPLLLCVCVTHRSSPCVRGTSCTVHWPTFTTAWGTTADRCWTCCQPPPLRPRRSKRGRSGSSCWCTSGEHGRGKQSHPGSICLGNSGMCVTGTGVSSFTSTTTLSDSLTPAWTPLDESHCSSQVFWLQCLSGTREIAFAGEGRQG